MKTQFHVLVIEDSSSWQAIYRDFLDVLGYGVSITASKTEAMLLLEQVTFDAFVIDIGLDRGNESNRDGLDILRWLFIRGESDKAIMNSGYLSKEVRQEIDRLCPFALIDKTEEARLVQLAESLARVVADSSLGEGAWREG